MVQKKLVYMYLTFYVHNKENQDLALLAINTMYKDCHHSNPMIRGFALRSLSSLKVKNLVEYIRPMVLKGLQDTASYVRKTAAIATIKLYHISPRSVQGLYFLSGNQKINVFTIFMQNLKLWIYCMT